MGYYNVTIVLNHWLDGSTVFLKERCYNVIIQGVSKRCAHRALTCKILTLVSLSQFKDSNSRAMSDSRTALWEVPFTGENFLSSLRTPFSTDFPCTVSYLIHSFLAWSWSGFLPFWFQIEFFLNFSQLQHTFYGDFHATVIH